MYQSIINALKNEKAIDAFDMLNIHKKRNFKLPVLRPIIVIQKIKSNLILKSILYVLTLCWIVLYPLLMVFKLVKYIKKLNYGSCNIDKNSSSMIIATSARIETVIDGIDKELIPSIYLEVPWININKLNLIKIDLMSVLSFYDLLKALAYSIKGVFISVKDMKHPVEVLQTYVLFEYFMLYIGLKKLKKENITSYWYSNHYDRWSVLLDCIGKNNVLLQHGFVNDRFELPYKLKNIKTLYYINEQSINIFKKNIINKNSNINAIQLKNTLELKTIENKNKSIFIISRPAQLELDIELIKILNELGIIIYIKPHPLFDKDPYKKAFSSNNKCILIEDNTYYPDVDIILSGYSTLAIEYELLGKKIIWIPKENLKSIKLKIIKYIGENKNV
jgi:hypothetical protein